MVVPAGTCVHEFVRTVWRVPGGVAQLGERLNGIQEVRGSIPLASTGPTVVSICLPRYCVVLVWCGGASRVGVF